MNIAVIIAGGKGARANQDVPKQFLTVFDTPIIVYTMMNIQSVDMIDEIIVVSPDGWKNFVNSYAKQYGISKLTKVIIGGDTRHESITNAVTYLSQNYTSTDTIVLIDANRPMIPQSIITNCIMSAQENRCCIALEPCNDSMFVFNPNGYIERNIDRTMLFKGQAPEAIRLDLLTEIYELSKGNNLDGFSTTALLIHFGKFVSSVQGSPKSFKITTADDFELFKALLTAEKSNNLKQE